MSRKSLGNICFGSSAFAMARAKDKSVNGETNDKKASASGGKKADASGMLAKSGGRYAKSKFLRSSCER